MPGKLISFLTAFLLLALLNTANTGDPVTVQDTYLKADLLFNSSNPSVETDSLAMAGFDAVIASLEKYPDRHLDSFLFQSYLSKGILLDVKAKNAEAKNKSLAFIKYKEGQNIDLGGNKFIYSAKSNLSMLYN